MTIYATHVGYREIQRISDFLQVIEKGNHNFSDLLESYGDVIISYDFTMDEVIIICNYDYEAWATIKNKCQVFYPADLDIDMEIERRKHN